MTEDCAAFQLPPTVTRVMPADGAVNIVAIVGTTFNRIFVKLDHVSAGDSVEVCAIGRRCRHNIQVGVGDATCMNVGRHDVSGTITVTGFSPADGRMNLTFNNVSLVTTALSRGSRRGACTPRASR